MAKNRRAKEGRLDGGTSSITPATSNRRAKEGLIKLPVNDAADDAADDAALKRSAALGGGSSIATADGLFGGYIAMPSRFVQPTIAGDAEVIKHFPFFLQKADGKTLVNYGCLISLDAAGLPITTTPTNFAGALDNGSQERMVFLNGIGDIFLQWKTDADGVVTADTCELALTATKYEAATGSYSILLGNTTDSPVKQFVSTDVHWPLGGGGDVNPFQPSSFTETNGNWEATINAGYAISHWEPDIAAPTASSAVASLSMHMPKLDGTPLNAAVPNKLFITDGQVAVCQIDRGANRAITTNGVRILAMSEGAANVVNDYWPYDTLDPEYDAAKPLVKDPTRLKFEIRKLFKVSIPPNSPPVVTDIYQTANFEIAPWSSWGEFVAITVDICLPPLTSGGAPITERIKIFKWVSPLV